MLLSSFFSYFSIFKNNKIINIFYVTNHHIETGHYEYYSIVITTQVCCLLPYVDQGSGLD